MDERVEGIKNQIYKEAYFIAFAICCVSVVVKTLVLGLEAGNAIAEYMVIILPGFWSLIRSVALGIYSDDVEVHDRTSRWSMSTKTVFIGLTSGLVIATFFGVRSATVYGDGSTSLWYFFITFMAALMIYLPLFVVTLVAGDQLARRSSKRASDEQLD